MEEFLEKRSAVLRRLQARREMLSRYLRKKGRQDVNPELSRELDEIDMAIENTARDIYRLDEL